jgi:predicted nucleic acid-binding Zn ribbon protein
MRRRRTPRPLSEAVAQALEGVEPATLLAAAQRAWPDAVGEAIARESSPVAERDGVITVACRSATWAQELDLLGARIREQLLAELPSGASVEGLRFTASPDPDQVDI